MRLFANANYDFLGARRIAYVATAAFLLAGIVAALVRGFNYSIEFTGGTQVQIQTADPVDVGELRNALQAQGIGGAEIQSFGSDREFVIRARSGAEGTDPNDTQATTTAVRAALDASMGADGYQVLKTGAISPRVGGELRTRAALAVLLSFVVVLVYLAIRFEWRFGLAAILATAHDILATLAFIALLRIEISLFVVAALLSIVGYSLNDTIVIFDRVRENLHKAKTEGFAAILNRSVNETLPRTVITGGTALGSLMAMAVLGGDVVRPFALVMLFGLVVGTFSSAFIASPLLLAIEERWPGPHARGLKRAAPRATPAGRRAQPVA
ncbi:MAG: protein translocase subunit SecF [Gemmatimonadota bacterium]|nr:protein translocase subunit SecF [Gemmatimonadota bacterium]